MFEVVNVRLQLHHRLLHVRQSVGYAMSRSTSDFGPVVLELALGLDVFEGAVPSLHSCRIPRRAVRPETISKILARLLSDRSRFVLGSSFHFLSVRGAFFLLLRESLLVVRES